MTCHHDHYTTTPQHRHDTDRSSPQLSIAQRRSQIAQRWPQQWPCTEVTLAATATGAWCHCLDATTAVTSPLIDQLSATVDGSNAISSGMVIVAQLLDGDGGCLVSTWIGGIEAVATFKQWYLVGGGEWTTQLSL